MPPLTGRQREVLSAIRRSQIHHGWTPSVRDLAVELGLRSPSTVQQHLVALERKGYLVRPGAGAGRARMVRVLVITPSGLDALNGGTG